MNRTVPILAIAVLALAACAAPASSPTTPPGSTPTTAPPTAGGSDEPTPGTSGEPDALLDLPLTDVRNGESFTLRELAAEDGPVLLEPMAIWCTNCKAQQRQVAIAHQSGGEFTSVSLDVDLSESADDLATYSEREGFDWRFALADPPLYRLLQERFGVAATNPPSTPLVIVEPDGTIRPLEFGVGTRSAEQLLAELEGG